MGLSTSLPNAVVQPGVCTSTTRPASPYKGQTIYETDTGRLLVYYGATTGWQLPWGQPWGIQSYFVDTVNGRTFTTAATIPNITGAVSVVKDRYSRLSFHCRFLNTVSNAGNSFEIRAATVSIASGIQQNLSIYVDQSLAIIGIYKAAATASVTFDVRAAAGSGTLIIYGANTPTFLSIEDIGPLTSTPPTA